MEKYQLIKESDSFLYTKILIKHNCQELYFAFLGSHFKYTVFIHPAWQFNQFL